jgi:RNA polymerase sigma-70 factor (family 1)
MSIVHENDMELWEQVKGDSDVAYSQLFDRYWEEMFSIAYRRVGDEATAKDIVQNIFIHTWENRRQIIVEETMRPYLFTALKYSVVRHIYRAARHGTTDLPLSVYSLPEEVLDHRQDLHEYDVLQEKLQSEIEEMPDKMREIFVLNHQQELSVREIALRLSLSEQTVKNQLGRALKRLRFRLRDQALFLSFLL